MSFRSSERELQLAWKGRTGVLSDRARAPGLYTGRPNGGGREGRNDHFLHEACCEENLLPWTRAEALALFRARGIDWHDGPSQAIPSNYLMDSMVSCVNCLAPFARQPDALAALLSPLVPGAARAVALDGDACLVFEWLGLENYLDERSPGRKPGRKGTSIDAHCVLETSKGTRVGVNIEWKYTEANTPHRKHGEHYLPMISAAGGAIVATRLGAPEALLVEPLYQLARQHLLAAAMEQAREHGADTVLQVLLVPDDNSDYRRLGASVPGHPIEGTDAIELFRSVLARPERLVVSSFQRLAAALPMERWPNPQECWREVLDRYVIGRAPVAGRTIGS